MKNTQRLTENSSLKNIRAGYLLTIFIVPVLTLFLSPVMALILDPILEPMISSCDYSAGGGSLNLCRNAQGFYAFIAAFVFAALAMWALQSFFKKEIKKADVLIGLSNLILAPLLTFFIYETVVTSLNIWGNERGAFNDTFLPFLAVFNILVFLLITFSPYLPKRFFSKNRKK